jgi:hypothetical protein
MGSSCSTICGSTVSFILFWGLGCFTATDLLAGFLGVASDGRCRRKEFRNTRLGHLIAPSTNVTPLTALHSLTFAGRIASLRVNSTLRLSVVDQFSVFLSLLALRQGPFAPSGFHRLPSLLWAPPTPSPSSPQCYCVPLQALQLDPSLGWVSQVPDCSFRARCPTLPRKVPVGSSVIFSPPGCWLPFPRGSWPLSSCRFEAFIRRFTFVAARSFALQRLQTTSLPVTCSGCFMFDDSLHG